MTNCCFFLKWQPDILIWALNTNVCFCQFICRVFFFFFLFQVLKHAAVLSWNKRLGNLQTTFFSFWMPMQADIHSWHTQDCHFLFLNVFPSFRLTTSRNWFSFLWNKLVEPNNNPSRSSVSSSKQMATDSFFFLQFFLC